MRYDAPFTDKYLAGLLQQDATVIRAIYTDFAPRIEAMVVQHGGNREDARDVLQEALVVIWRKAQDADFTLSSGFFTYLYSVSRFTWLRKKKKRTITPLRLKAWGD